MVARSRRLLSSRSKYQSYWYGNALAVTIYVNANGAAFLSQLRQPFALNACKIVRLWFHYVDRRSTYVSTAG
jgi:hypothetical protein